MFVKAKTGLMHCRKVGATAVKCRFDSTRDNDDRHRKRWATVTQLGQLNAARS
jgi:hypothetical protein